jgi:hypothetical protein
MAVMNSGILASEVESTLKCLISPFMFSNEKEADAIADRINW